MKFWAALLAMIALSLAGPAAAQSERSGAKKSKNTAISSSMIFYLAKGADDACGRGCNEWIAAEGQIDGDSAQRLRAILTRVGKRKLPIYFHSPGGNGLTSAAMGRLLREREMTAGVYQTIPTGCAGLGEQACRALKQSGQVLQSSLHSFANCSSACTFALIGAKVRDVPPGARLGVHSAKLVVFRSDGSKINYADGKVASYRKSRLAELNGQLRRYVQEMKIDIRLFDLISKVPHEDIHYLTRDEIVRFGIDTREFNESRWVATELIPQKLWAMKFFVPANDERRKELRPSLIRVECGSAQQAKLSYFRALGSDDAGIKRTLDLAGGNRKIGLLGNRSAMKFDAIEKGTSFELWTAELTFGDLEATGARPHIEITESYNADLAPRVTRLSTAGMPQAVDALRERCSSMSN